jgi:nitrile hydratase accessory protein
MPTDPDLTSLPNLPQDEDGPVFKAPWQAHAFAMVMKLHEGGCFTWDEWATRLSEAIKQAQADGDPDLGNTYYEHWLVALEGIIEEKDLLPAALIAERQASIKAEHAQSHGHEHSHEHGHDHG